MNMIKISYPIILFLFSMALDANCQDLSRFNSKTNGYTLNQRNPYLFHSYESMSEIIIYNKTDSTTENEKFSFPRFDVHIGFGSIIGGRIGSRVLINNHFSFEASYGKDYRNFIGLSDEINKYGIGINYFLSSSSNFAISLLGVYQYYTDVDFKNDTFILSPSIGFLSLRTAGLKTFIRAGFYFELINFQTKSFGATNFGINIDIGLTWSFP